MLKTLARLSGQQIIFPLYHALSDNPLPHIRHLYKVKSVDEFKKDLDYVQKRFKQLDFSNYASLKSGAEKNKQPSFMLTFDDGTRDFYEIVAPILKERKLHAVIFINSGFIDNKDLFYRFKASCLIDQIINGNRAAIMKAAQHEFKSSQLYDAEAIQKINSVRYIDRERLNRIAAEAGFDFQQYIREYKPYMTLKELQELENEGFIIGAHGVDHAYFQDIPYDEQLRQISESIAFINAHLKTFYKLFAFPFTDFKLPHLLFETVFEEKIVDYTFGTAEIKDDIFDRSIQRISFEKGPSSIRIKLYKAYLTYLIKKCIGKNTYTHS